MTAALSEVAHLVRRFFGFLAATPPSPSEQRFVHDHLAPAEARVFWEQRPEDQRHAIDVARRVAAAADDDDELIRAALLHDVGKAAAPIGALRRSVATVLDVVGLPLPRAMATYRDHGRLGAERLERVGADGIVVAFASHHPGPPPAGYDQDRWAILLSADRT